MRVVDERAHPGTSGVSFPSLMHKLIVMLSDGAGMRDDGG